MSFQEFGAAAADDVWPAAITILKSFLLKMLEPSHCECPVPVWRQAESTNFIVSSKPAEAFHSMFALI